MLAWWIEAAVAAPGEAAAPEEAWALHAGEFRNNAWTLPKGAFTLRPFLKSSVGLTSRIDLKAPILGEILGPKVSVELGLVQTERLAISLEPYLDAGWRFRNWELGAVARVSVVAGEGWVNLNVGGAAGHVYATDLVRQPDGTKDEVVIDAPVQLVPVNLGYDWTLQERTWLRFVVTTDVAALAAAQTPFTVGVNWNHALGRVRVALGGALVIEKAVRAPVPVPGQERLVGGATYPAPTVEVWGRW